MEVADPSVMASNVNIEVGGIGTDFCRDAVRKMRDSSSQKHCHNTFAGWYGMETNGAAHFVSFRKFKRLLGDCPLPIPLSKRLHQYGYSRTAMFPLEIGNFAEIFRRNVRYSLSPY